MRNAWEELKDRRARDCDDGGLSVEFISLFLVLLLPMLIGLHITLRYLAEEAAVAAAEVAVDVAQVDGATSGEGQAAAQAYLAQAGFLRDSNVQVSVDITGAITVTVTGESLLAVIPAGTTVEVTAEGTVEEFISEADR